LESAEKGYALRGLWSLIAITELPGSMRNVESEPKQSVPTSSICFSEDAALGAFIPFRK
jgi:hypothetical protein